MLKNFKFYRKSFFKRCKAFVLALNCAFFSTVSLSSCSSNEGYDYKDDDKSITSSDYISDNNDHYCIERDTIQDSTYSNQYNIDNNYEYTTDYSLYVDNESNAYFQKYVDNIKTDYEYSELYDVENVLSKYYQLDEYDSSINGIITNNYVDSDILYNTVLNNNRKYLRDNNQGYSELDDSYLRKSCDVIATNINQHLLEDEIDVSELDNKLFDLKILSYSSFSYGFYSQDSGILGVNLNSINGISNDIDSFESIVRHESNHIIQANSILESDKEGYEIKFGPSYSFNNVDVNSLFWNWYFEGSAESLNINDYNKESLIYTNELKCLDTIKVATILNKDNGVYDLEKLSLQSDLDKLFTYFNCDSQDDKEEIVKMFYAFNIICRNDNQSSSDDFIRKYKEIYGNLDLNNYSNQLKGSISLTLSKQFYSNLFDEIVEKQTKLDDILQLIVVYENEISRLTWYQSKYSELNNFLNNYVNMQDEAFKILADKCGISYDELRQIYEQYNKSRNTNISWLSDEKNAFYNYITNTRFNDKKDSIYTVYTNNYSYVKTIN